MPEMSMEQRAATDFREGAMLLLAGPGSGKTFVLTHRIKALMETGVPPESILVITFTKAAALEMQERFFRLAAPDSPPVTFGTFHSVFYSILKSHSAYRNVVPVTDKEKLNMIRRAAEIARLENLRSDQTDLSRTLGLISSCKNNGNDPASFRQDRFDSKDFVSIFNAYNETLREFNRIDFDDMINLCLELVRSDENLRENWQERFKYILVDEFQDISANQYELVKILGAPEGNIFAVGDDDQAIYGFRGARVGLMKQFLEDNPGAVKAELSANYRSLPAIVEASALVISDNKDRFEKNIRASRTGKDPLSVRGMRSVQDQNKRIIEEIEDRVKGGLSFEEIAILCRTNRQCGEYATLLRAADIPVSFSSRDLPFDSGTVKDILAYMAFAAGDRRREVFLRIMNKPVRFIKRAALTEETVTEEGLLRFYSNDPNMSERIGKLFADLRAIHDMRPFLAVHYICNSVGYDPYIRDNVTLDKYMDHKEEKDQLLSLVRDMGSYHEVRDRIELIRKKAMEDTSKSAARPGVRIQTFHASKGLEYDSVILPDVNEGRIPPRSVRLQADIEEERRMFYVAMTRAKDHLTILYRQDDNLKPSRFIKRLL